MEAEQVPQALKGEAVRRPGGVGQIDGEAGEPGVVAGVVFGDGPEVMLGREGPGSRGGWTAKAVLWWSPFLPGSRRFCPVAAP